MKELKATPVETASPTNEEIEFCVEIDNLRAQLNQAREELGHKEKWPPPSKKLRLLKENERLRLELTQVREELRQAVSSRLHTQDWYARHYGKLEDWARKRLPDPWRTEFFNCVANGTWGFDDVGEPYMSQVGRIVPSGYFKMDTAAEQLLQDQYVRAESAELKLGKAEAENKRLSDVIEGYGRALTKHLHEVEGATGAMEYTVKALTTALNSSTSTRPEPDSTEADLPRYDLMLRIEKEKNEKATEGC